MNDRTGTESACKQRASHPIPRSQRELVELSLRLNPAPKSTRRCIERDRRSVPSH